MKLNFISIVAVLLFLVGCGQAPEVQQGEHFAKDQEKAFHKVEGLEAQMLDNAAQQRQAIDEQAQ